MQIMVAHGPSTTRAARLPPHGRWCRRGWARCTFIMVKEKAAPMAIKGTYLDLSQFLTFPGRHHPRGDHHQAGSSTHVEGLKYPSGMCMLNPPLSFQGIGTLESRKISWPKNYMYGETW